MDSREHRIGKKNAQTKTELKDKTQIDSHSIKRREAEDLVCETLGAGPGQLGEHEPGTQEEPGARLAEQGQQQESTKIKQDNISLLMSSLTMMLRLGHLVPH